MQTCGASTKQFSKWPVWGSWTINSDSLDINPCRWLYLSFWLQMQTWVVACIVIFFMTYSINDLGSQHQPSSILPPFDTNQWGIICSDTLIWEPIICNMKVAILLGWLKHLQWNLSLLLVWMKDIYSHSESDPNDKTIDSLTWMNCFSHYTCSSSVWGCSLEIDEGVRQTHREKVMGKWFGCCCDERYCSGGIYDTNKVQTPHKLQITINKVQPCSRYVQDAFVEMTICNLCRGGHNHKSLCSVPNAPIQK